MRKIVVCALMAGTIIASGGLASSASAARITGRPGHGCPRGAFCIYPGMKTWRTGPERHGIYYSYGAHNLHHQLGWHLVYNNQYPVNGVSAGVSLCRGFNGRRGWTSQISVPTSQSAAPYMTEDQAAGFANLTPVNSITLWLFDLSGSQFSLDFICRA